MVLQDRLRMAVLAVIAMMAAFVLAFAFVSSAHGADTHSDVSAPFVLQEGEDDEDANGEENGNGVTEDDDEAAPGEAAEDEDEDVAPAETGSGGFSAGQTGAALGVIILGLVAALSLVTGGRLATRRQ